MTRKGTSVQEIVTDNILKKLETAPEWEKGWTITTIPRNYVSNRPYTGINILLLGLSSPFGSPYWMTYKQATEQGGHVKKGETSSIAVFWKPGEVKEVKKPDGTTKKEYGAPVFRYYRVFNWEQTGGVPEKTQPKLHHDPITACEMWFDSLVVSPTIKTDNAHGPHYAPARDEIHLPDMGSFTSPERYYKTRGHETVHWKGHSSRLNRLKLDEVYTDEKRAYEELIAELGAAIFAAGTGISPDTEDNSAAYVRSWLIPLQNDPGMIIKAAAAAQKAITYLTGGKDLTAPVPAVATNTKVGVVA